MAEVLGWQRDLFHAEKLLKKARQLYPHDESTALASAKNYRLMGRFDKAIEVLKTAHFD